jgi:signal transduction histidine kinase
LVEREGIAGGHEEGSGEVDFQGRIGRRLSVGLTLPLIVVLVVGGVSILLARSIYVSTEDIEVQAQHIETIDAVHAAVHHLVSAVQRSIISGVPLPEDEQQNLSGDLRALMARYAELEAMDTDHPDQEQEMKIFLEIGQMITGLLPLSEKLFKAVALGRAIDRRDLDHLTTVDASVPNMTHEMNKIHRANIKRSIEQSQGRLWVILGLYLAFIMVGSVLVVGSTIVFRKSIVLPLRQLASATQEVASGDFRKRVSVTSQDEIGQLAHSFNVMAEQLEEHEKSLQMLATQKERERIAREMHDGLAQALGYVHMHLATLEARTSAEGDDGMRGELREIKKVVGEAYEEIRQSIFGLRTMVSRGLGLIPTLTEYLHDFSQQSGIAVDLQIGDDRATRFSADVEVQLVRIIQEALANIRKHAGGRRAVVRFDVEGNRCCVTVRDDGHGFELRKVPKQGSRHIGLQAMRERAEGIGGTLEIDAAPGRGTKVMVRVPL